METQTETGDFLNFLKDSYEKNALSRVTLGKVRKNDHDLKNVFIRPVIIGNEKLLSFIYRHQTRDITKNYDVSKSIEKIKKLLEENFLQANLFSSDADLQLMISKKGKSTLKKLKPSSPVVQPFSHDKIKKRLITPDGKIYLRELGITNAQFEVIPSMNSKFKQINRFVEIISSELSEKSNGGEFKVVDMGSGKGYLTFALYDYLVNALGFDAGITGVELRKELVDQCNRIAKKAGFSGLTFEENNIHDFQPGRPDMLIALHACDTATDDALFKGITSRAKYIIVAPCCHKQVRKAMHPGKLLTPVLRHGIYLERQAELLTDGIRGLILEKYGYKVKTIEFISTEHTPKNVMIIAVKTGKFVDKDKFDDKILQIKKTFGIEYHHLEQLMAGY